MYFQKDWLMRQIEDMCRIIVKILFGKDYKKYEIVDETHLSETDLWYTQLMALTAQKRLCEAEDLLFDSIDPANPSHMAIALDFYQTINTLSDEELENADFSREEIRDGLKQLTVLRGLNIDAVL